MSKNQETGKYGETRAVALLERNGFKILERNWKCSYAEIDIIAMEQGRLVFVEVKTRKNKVFGSPETFVSQSKMQLMAEAANIYMEQSGHEWEIRFDVISITLFPHFELIHFKDAFFPDLY